MNNKIKGTIFRLCGFVLPFVGFFGFFGVPMYLGARNMSEVFFIEVFFGIVFIGGIVLFIQGGRLLYKK